MCGYPNGYDLHDFAALNDSRPAASPQPGRPLKLLYTGTVFQSHPLDDLWAAFALLSPDQRRGFEVEIVGRVVPGQVVDPGLELMVPAKLFEYLAVRRPVLGILPRGAASKIVEAAEAGAVVQPGQAQELAAVLARWLKEPPIPSEAPPRAFDRRALAGMLARTLDEALRASTTRQ